jgi:glycosyltransferase involved in cell wall biosynthesis
MNPAIVHDYLNQNGGAEKVVEVFHEIFPEAPIFTTIYDSSKFPSYYKDFDIRTTFMQGFPFLEKHFKKYLLFYPKAIESIDLGEYDLVLSSSSSFAKGAVKGSGACHICYCHAPMRFVWDYEKYIEKENFGPAIKKILPIAISYLKKWDLNNTDRVDYFIANSEYIKNRIKDIYNRNSIVINPPVNVDDFSTKDETGDYFLIVSRLNAYKNIDLAVRAFNKLGLRLKIVGSGPYRDTLESIAEKDNIEFTGRLDNGLLRDAYSRCRAFIFPGREDFGITPVEAQASGRPVIAFAAGGALETVIDGVTGLFFKENSIDCFIDAIKRFIKIEDSFDKEKIVENARKFDRGIFKIKIKEYVTEKFNEYTGT